ncbi:unnamed protein product [Cylindrotheca closterium]|uniref:Uncharacterized protein n=1 Tax=Cylindrotheca closterium TaxID=2856 RepID=A0AAD2G4B5_9STRA|nr:unnamed protein product [Cylindrotheca closterium]
MEHDGQGFKDTDFTGLTLGDVMSKVNDLEVKSQKSESHALEMEEKFKKSESLLQEMMRRLAVSENQLANMTGLTPGPNQWFRVGSSEAVESSSLPKEYHDEQFVLPRDVYSVVASCHWRTLPFWISLFIIFGFQIFLLVLLLEDQVNWGGDNVLGIPANVETTVRTAQILALIIALFDQDDIRIGIEGLSDGVPSLYNGDGRFERVNVMQWAMAYALRFGQGFLGLFCSFLLLVQAETVFDVLLNFLGVKFVSELDDLAFILGGQGYFGSSLKQCVKATSSATFLREQRPSNSSCSDIKKYANVVGVFTVLIAMAAVFATLAIRQDEGTFSIPQIAVEFGDEVLPYLGLFNGFYKANQNGNFHRRLVYEQVGVDNEHSGKLGWCSNLEDEGEGSGGWIFFTNSANPCAEYIIRSEATKTFDVLEAGATQWYIRDGRPLDYLEVTRVFNAPQDYWRETFDENQRPCEEVHLSGSFKGLQGTGTRSSTFQQLPTMTTMIISENQIPDSSTLAHPIYVGRSSSEVVLFTGRRWVLVEGDKVPNLSRHRNSSSLWDMDGLREFFYGRREFLSMNQSNDWVLLVSEIVEAATNPGSPLGLQWFHPRYDLDSTYNFPFADLTRPQVAKMGCARCDEEANPCAYEGICHDGICTCSNRATGSLCQVVQTVQIPNGAKCELARRIWSESLFDLAVFFGNDTDNDPIRKIDTLARSVSWTVPSKCIMDVLSRQLGTVPMDDSIQGAAVAAQSADSMAAFLCSFDEDLLLERYALAVMYQSWFLLEADFNEHQCNSFGFAVDGSTITCNSEDKVADFVKGSNRLDSTIPPEIFLLSDLESLVFASHNVVGTLPTELGLLTKLTHIDAFGNRLVGQIPSEIGLLTNLVTLNLGYNSFTGSLPAELSNLQNLNNCTIVGNNLTWTNEVAVCQ